jgi:hypothetical protein
MALKTMILSTTGATQTLNVPSDWNSSSNNVHVIGAGVHGGGAYATIANLALTPSGTCAYRIAAGLTASGDAGDTWISNTGVAPTTPSEGALADGANGSTGGLASASVGTTKNNGGNAGSSSGFGGGAAGGPNGPGGNGGSATSAASGGGGGANGGENGNTDGQGHGGDNRFGTDGGMPSNLAASPSFTPPTSGANGAGGGGDVVATTKDGTLGVGDGGAGSMEVLWTDNSGGPNNGQSAGPGGGGGGGQDATSDDTAGGAGGLYGGGGGDDDGGSGADGAGAQGCIVLIWDPATALVATRIVGVIA